MQPKLHCRRIHIDRIPLGGQYVKIKQPIIIRISQHEVNRNDLYILQCEQKVPTGHSVSPLPQMCLLRNESVNLVLWQPQKILKVKKIVQK